MKRMFLFCFITLSTYASCNYLVKKPKQIIKSGTYHINNLKGCAWKLYIKNDINEFNKGSISFIGIPEVEPKGKIDSYIKLASNNIVAIGTKNQDSSINIFSYNFKNKKLPLNEFHFVSKDKNIFIRVFKSLRSCKDYKDEK